MSTAQVEKLFQAFTQADGTTTRRYGGTGLGLAICQRLVAMMGGRIEVDSVEGEGSRFFFDLELGLLHPYCMMHASRAGDGQAAPSFAGQRVLVVEDNRINQQVARELLESAGLVVDVVENGRDGVAQMFAEAYDLVLMDIQMPVMDGYQATAIIRGEERFAAMPIVAMTAHAMDSDRERCLQVGMNGHITKPIDPNQLYQVLSQWLAVGEGRAVDVVEADGEVEKEAADGGKWALLPAVLPGIRMEEGLERVRGSRSLLARLLREFYGDHRNTYSRLTQALADGKGKDVQCLVHTLKGAAGNLGATSLSKAAAAVEDALGREGLSGSAIGVSAALDRSLTELGTAFAQVMAGLVPLVEKKSGVVPDVLSTEVGPGTEVEQKLVDMAAFFALAQKLEQQLLEADPAAADLLPELQQILGGGWEKHCRVLQEHVHAFAFEKALESVRHLMQEVEAEKGMPLAVENGER